MITFKGIKANTLGLVFSTFPTLPVPTKIIDRIKIPGRIEHLIQDSQNIEPIQIQVEGVALNSDLLTLRNFFSGSGELVLEDYPEYIFKATIAQEVYLKQDVGNTIDFLCIFDCQPAVYLKSGKVKQTFIISQVTLNNPGTLPSKPMIKVFGNGNISISKNGSTLISVTGVSEYVVFDSELDSVYKNAQSLERNTVGVLPILNVGSNVLTFNGNITKIEIIPNWRAL